MVCKCAKIQIYRLFFVLLLGRFFGMRISRISAHHTPLILFSAKTKVTAPESLLSKEDKEYFEQLGRRIKPDTDTIEIGISNLYSSKTNPNVQCYDVTKTMGSKGDNSSSMQSSTISVPYIKNGIVQEKNSPKNYLEKLFSRWQKKD